MKIFNEEKSKRVVYVQRNDLAMLDASSLVVPGSCLITGLVDDSNRYDFVRFEDPRVVEFFEGIDWIVDFKSLKGQDDEVYADAKKAEEVLGWTAKFGIEEMCEDTWRWQSQNPDGF